MDLLALHTPDGFLSHAVAAAAAVPAVLAVGYALRVSGRELDDRRATLFGVLAAFVFSAQMLNFPIAGGTSGHFLGATLVAVLLGPWLACLAMAVVIAIQALAFADGGIAALGANVLNMGVLGALGGGLAIGAAVRALRPGRVAFVGLVGGVAWLAVVLGAAATAVEIAASGTAPLGAVLPAMLGMHALIGVGEAAITAVAVAAVLAVRPDLIALGDVDPVPPAPAAIPAPAAGPAESRA